jgi:hypothetical protein
MSRPYRIAAARTAALAAALLLAVAGAAAPAHAQSNPLLGAARLQGTFELAGHLTVAAQVRGERDGQSVTRSWSFTSTCPAGACSTVALSRQRVAGTDALTLSQTSPGYYVGTGGFYAPLQCGTATYLAGEWVPFTITVQVTNAAIQSDGSVLATSVATTYRNGYRVNLTPCVAVLGHDAAAYQGQLTGPARDVKGKRKLKRRRG